MIYIIGGSPRSGKSILSRKLSKKLNVPYISTDNLRLVVLPYFKGKDKDKNFPFIKMYNPISTDEFFQEYSRQKMLKADIQEAKSIWPGVKSFVDHLLICKADYIIEGIHLLPNLVKQFKNNKNIKIVFLAKLEERKIYQGLMRNSNNSDWLMDNLKDKKTISIAAKAFCDYGRFFIKEAKKFGFEIITMDNNFTQKINKTVQNIAKMPKGSHI